MRKLPWPKLLLVWLFAALLATSLLVARWDPTVPYDHLKVTTGQLDHFDHHCVPADQYSPEVCGDTAYFRTDDGRRLALAFAQLLPRIPGEGPLELRYDRSGAVWTVAQGGQVLVSYDAIREQHDVLNRIGRAFALLGCLGAALMAGKPGLLRLRAGPACPSRMCRALDYGTVAVLLVATAGLARRAFLPALAGTLSAALLFVLAIRWAAHRHHIDADIMSEKLLRGAAATWIHRPGRWLEEALSFLDPPREALTTPWRAITFLTTIFFSLGFCSLLAAGMSSLMNILIWRSAEDGLWALCAGAAVFGVVLLGLSRLLGLLLGWATGRPGGGTLVGWTILGLPLLLVALALT